MRGWYAKLAIAEGAKRLATHLTRQIIEKKGGDGGDAGRLFLHVAVRHPEILRSILSTKNPADGEEAIQAAFESRAEQFAGERANAFAAIDRLDVPVSAKDRMKTHVLRLAGVGVFSKSVCGDDCKVPGKRCLTPS